MITSHAQTWSGGGSGNNWGTANNWVSNTVPASNGTAVIIFDSSSKLSPVVDKNWRINSLTFNASASAYSISGSRLTIGSGGITNNSSNNQAIVNAITLNASQTWNSVLAGEVLSIGPGIGPAATAVALGSNTLTLAGAGDTLLNNVALTGSGNVIVDGTGTVTYYGGANTYTGTTTVKNGTLVVSSTSGSNNGIKGNLVIGDGVGAADSALVRSGPVSSPVANEVIANSSTVTINSDGKLDLNNQTETIAGLALTGGHVDSRASGSLIINGNVTTTASAQTALIEGNLNLNAGTRTFTVVDGAAASDLTINALISNGGLTKAGTGVLTLTNAANSYTSGTIVNGGTVAVSANGNLGAIAGGITLNGGTLEATASFSTARAVTLGTSDGTVQTDNGVALTMSGVISGGANTLTKTGTGTLTLSAANTYTGGTFISGGTLAVGANNNLGASGGLTLNGGTLETTAGFTLNRTISLGASGGTLQTDSGTLVASGVVSGAGSLTKTGAGALTLSGTNLYTGGTTISAGTLSITNNNNLGNASGGLTLNGGILATTGNIAMARALTLNNTSGNTIQTTSGTLTLSGAVSGTGDLTKTRAGTLAFSTSVNLGGDLTLSGGTLAFLGNSTLTIADTLHITATSTIDFGTGSSSTLNVGTLLIDAGVQLIITGWSNGLDQFIAQNFPGATLDDRGGLGVSQVVFTGYTGGNTTWQSYDRQVTPVPEPSTYGVILIGGLALGLGGRGFYRSRKQRKAIAMR